MHTDEFNLQKQPSSRPIDPPRLEAARHLFNRSSLPSLRLLCPTPQRRPAVPERQLPAKPAIRPLSTESTVPMLRWLLRCLTPAQTVYLPVVPDKQRPCAAPRPRPVRCSSHFDYSDAAFTATLSLSRPVLALSRPARGRLLNQPTTKPCSLQIENQSSSYQRWSLHGFQTSHFICHLFGCKLWLQSIQNHAMFLSRSLVPRCCTCFDVAYHFKSYGINNSADLFSVKKNAGRRISSRINNSADLFSVTVLENG